MDNTDNEAVRLQVYLAKSGIGSRRRCETFISEGLVSVNGKIVTEMGLKVTAEDRIVYKGRVIKQEDNKVYLALNKPSLYICSSSDPENRKLAVDLVKKDFPVRLYNVGRLDYLSTGLIFFTNDGDFAKFISHPSSGIEKEYIVETKQMIPEEMLIDFKNGAMVKGEKYQILSYRYKTKFKVSLVLEEGKNREIRRFFQSRNMKIRKLHRVRIGIVNLGQIPPGSYRRLTRKEVDWFLKKSRSKK